MTGLSVAMLPRRPSNFKRWNNLNYLYHSFKASRDFNINHLIGYWYRPLHDLVNSFILIFDWLGPPITVCCSEAILTKTGTCFTLNPSKFKAPQNSPHIPQESTVRQHLPKNCTFSSAGASRLNKTLAKYIFILSLVETIERWAPWEYLFMKQLGDVR